MGSVGGSCIFFFNFMIIVKEGKKCSFPCLASSREDPEISSMPGEGPKQRVVNVCGGSIFTKYLLCIGISVWVDTGSSPPLKLTINSCECAVGQGWCLGV